MKAEAKGEVGQGAGDIPVAFFPLSEDNPGGIATYHFNFPLGKLKHGERSSAG
jgi:hypothetical protein